MTFQDRILMCRDCGSSFTFTSGEQAFFAERGFVNNPSRCSGCRHAHKTKTESSAAFSSDYIQYGPFASFGGRSPRQMHPATCDHCGEVTEVPFVPRSDRPVYCSECYSNLRSQEPQDAAEVRDRRHS